jgi:hypothetical protein
MQHPSLLFYWCFLLYSFAALIRFMTPGPLNWLPFSFSIPSHNSYIPESGYRPGPSRFLSLAFFTSFSYIFYRTAHRTRCSVLVLLIPIMYLMTPRPVSRLTTSSCILSRSSPVAGFVSQNLIFLRSFMEVETLKFETLIFGSLKFGYLDKSHLLGTQDWFDALVRSSLGLLKGIFPNTGVCLPLVIFCQVVASHITYYNTESPQVPARAW